MFIIDKSLFFLLKYNYMDEKEVVEETKIVEEPDVNNKGKFFSRLKEQREKKKKEKIEEFKK